MPRGVGYKIPLAELLEAAEHHRRGWSLRSIARLKWRQWGYASAASAPRASGRPSARSTRPVRDRIDATVQASVMHGNGRRAARVPGHPDHERWLEHRRASSSQPKGAIVTQPERSVGIVRDVTIIGTLWAAWCLFWAVVSRSSRPL